MKIKIEFDITIDECFKLYRRSLLAKIFGFFEREVITDEKQKDVKRSFKDYFSKDCEQN